jgi:D-alanine-D-alanine ligase
MKIAFAYNVKKSRPSVNLAAQDDLEFDGPEVIGGIKSALEAQNHTVFEVEADLNAFKRLSELKDEIDIVFNIAEGQYGDARESQIPLFCEILKLPYTHSSPTTHALTLNKRLTNLALSGAGILTPKSILVNTANDLRRLPLEFPVIVKPNAEGSSKGVFDANVVSARTSLFSVVKHISEDFTKPVLIEEFIDGREFTVALLGNNPVQVLPIVEQRFEFLPQGMNKIASFELKWLYEDNLSDLSEAYFCPAPLKQAELKLIEETSQKVYRLLDCRDCARIDYRYRNGQLYFIEINTLPGINPDEGGISYFPLAARTAGMNYQQLIAAILEAAVSRYKKTTPEGVE